MLSLKIFENWYVKNGYKLHNNKQAFQSHQCHVEKSFQCKEMTRLIEVR